MIVLADNDLILKLAQCDLLKDLCVLLAQEGETGVYVLPTARYQLLPKNAKKALDRAGTTAVLDAVKEFLDKADQLPEVEDEALLASLEGIEGIDHGEQLLLASMVETESSVLVTGDRRALKAVISNQEAMASVFVALHEKVLTFESALLLAIAEFGFPNVKQRLLGNPKPDGVLRLVLKEEMNEQDLVACLVSYCKDCLPFLARRDILVQFFQS